MSSPAAYNVTRLPFMKAAGPSMPVSEPYVCVPPALVIRDRDGATWTLGFQHAGSRTGEFEFDVVRNGVDTGEKACRIEYRQGVVRIYGAERWRSWNGRTFI